MTKEAINKVGELLQAPAENEEIARLRAELQAVYRQHERKTERIQLLIRPSLKTALDDMAAKEGTSRNELITRLLEAGIKD